MAQVILLGSPYALLMKEKVLTGGIVLSSDNSLFLRESQILIVSDLHIGYEASMRAEGVAIPDFQMKEILDNLGRTLDHFSPETLIINGDIKHEFGKNLGQEWDEVMELAHMVKERGVDLKLVRGNHDNFLKTIVGRLDIELANYYLVNNIIKDVLIYHGHKNIEPAGFDGLRIFGHEHPVLRLRDEIGARITMPCFLYDEFNKFMIMPAFSPLASGTNVIAPTRNFMIEELRNRDISGARIFAIGEGKIMDFGLVGDHVDDEDI
ncbi:MAG: metallophosphoesterase [Thermoplasmata archaeon]|nr:metallophosphoesterase [Thermoplasmata archaeon]